MSKVVRTETVRGWTLPSDQASKLLLADLVHLGVLFECELNIVHINDGGILIYPERTSDRRSFDAFMQQNGQFTQRPINLNTT